MGSGQKQTDQVATGESLLRPVDAGPGLSEEGLGRQSLGDIRNVVADSKGILLNQEGIATVRNGPDGSVQEVTVKLEGRTPYVLGISGNELKLTEPDGRTRVFDGIADMRVTDKSIEISLKTAAGERKLGVDFAGANGDRGAGEFIYYMRYQPEAHTEYLRLFDGGEAAVKRAPHAPNGADISIEMTKFGDTYFIEQRGNQVSITEPDGRVRHLDGKGTITVSKESLEVKLDGENRSRSFGVDLSGAKGDRSTSPFLGALVYQPEANTTYYRTHEGGIAAVKHQPYANGANVSIEFDVMGGKHVLEQRGDTISMRLPDGTNYELAAKGSIQVSADAFEVKLNLPEGERVVGVDLKTGNRQTGAFLDILKNQHEAHTTYHSVRDGGQLRTRVAPHTRSGADMTADLSYGGKNFVVEQWGDKVVIRMPDEEFRVLDGKARMAVSETSLDIVVESEHGPQKFSLDFFVSQGKMGPNDTYRFLNAMVPEHFEREAAQMRENRVKWKGLEAVLAEEAVRAEKMKGIPKAPVAPGKVTHIGPESLKGGGRLAGLATLFTMALGAGIIRDDSN